MSRSIPLDAPVTRRTLVKNLGFAAVVAAVLPPRRSLAAVVAAVLPPRRSLAAEAPHLDVKDPAAMAVGYVEDASGIDLKKYPAHVKDSTCENCLLLQGTTGSHYRPCDLFPGKLVSVSGWCSGWTAEI